MAIDRVWSNFILDLKAKNDIVDVISSYLPVTQKGRSFWTLCPFHNDRNPSMSINKEGQFYHCFVCNAGGDVIKFVQEYESCSFIEAVNILAKRAKMEVPLTRGNPDKDVADKKRLRDACFDACLYAARFYNKNLYKPNNAYALEYLKKRGLKISTIKSFGFGLSDSWDGLPTELKKGGKNTDDALKAGLIVKKADGDFLDSLAMRLIVPIFDINGNVIAFGGRTFSHDKTVAKYKNTSVTPIFDKSKTLYALNYAKKAKQSGNLDFIVVVEGYMDAVALHQAGFCQAVASMGTSLTAEQAKLIKRLVPLVYICYDGDKAGQNATVRGLDILKEQGLEVRVVSLPDGVDPDEYVKAHGADGFKKLLAHALPLIDYKLKLAKAACAPKVDGKIAYNEYRRKYAQAALDILKGLTAVERESYLAPLSEETGLSVDFLRRQSDVASDEAPAPSVEPTDEPPPRDNKAVIYILASKLSCKPFAADGEYFYCDDNFLNNVTDFLKQNDAEGRKTTLGDVYNLPDASQNQSVVDGLLSVKFGDLQTDKKRYDDCVAALKKAELTELLAKLTADYQTETDTAKKGEILRNIAVITQKINTKA